MRTREEIIREVRAELLDADGDQELREVILDEVMGALKEAGIALGDAHRQLVHVASARAVGTLSVTYADRATAAIARVVTL